MNIEDDGIDEEPVMRRKKPNSIVSFFKGCMSTKPKPSGDKAKRPVPNLEKKNKPREKSNSRDDFS